MQKASCTLLVGVEVEHFPLSDPLSVIDTYARVNTNPVVDQDTISLTLSTNLSNWVASGTTILYTIYPGNTAYRGACRTLLETRAYTGCVSVGGRD